jgi:hypothetical protein
MKISATKPKYYTILFYSLNLYTELMENLN